MNRLWSVLTIGCSALMRASAPGRTEDLAMGHFIDQSASVFRTIALCKSGRQQRIPFGTLHDRPIRRDQHPLAAVGVITDVGEHRARGRNYRADLDSGYFDSTGPTVAALHRAAIGAAPTGRIPSKRRWSRRRTKSR